MTEHFPRWLAGSVIAGALAVALLSWGVGHFGSEGRFDWDLAAVFGTALGTTLLAVTTGGLAYLTGRDVSATRELARLQREDQLARERPTVLLHTAGYGVAAGIERINVSLRNVGLGPALNVRVDAMLTTPHEVASATPFRWAAISPGETASFVLAIDTVQGVEDPSKTNVRIEGSYTDRRRTEHYPILTDVRTQELQPLAESE